LVENVIFYICDAQNLYCRLIENFDFFKLLLENQLHVASPVSFIIQLLTLGRVFLAQLEEQRFAVDLYDLLDVVEVFLAEQALLGDYNVIKLLGRLQLCCFF